MRMPEVGDKVMPDRWMSPSTLAVGDEFGRFRLQAPVSGYRLAVNVEVTGKCQQRDGSYRCRVTFLGDGGWDVTSGGRIWFAQRGR